MASRSAGTGAASVFPKCSSKTWAETAGLPGRAFTSTVIADEVPATCHPLGKNNKLIFAPGIMSGSPAADSGRLSAGAKSPLTGGIKESNAGGLVSQKLAKLGITALVLEDKPQDDDYSMIVINKDGVEIMPAGDLVKKGNYDVMETLWDKYGKLYALPVIS